MEFSVRDTGQEVSQTCALTLTRWGLARKINYLGDWLMSLSWCLLIRGIFFFGSDKLGTHRFTIEDIKIIKFEILELDIESISSLSL